jgi:hypothetical protein
MNIPDHFSEILETIFKVKILKFFNADPDPVSGIFFTLYPGWKNSDQGSGTNSPGSATLVVILVEINKNVE